MTDFLQVEADAKQGIAALAAVVPDVVNAFMGLAKASLADGALDGKTKELMALGISIATQCDGCIVWHAKAAHGLGATREEICETVGVAADMRGGPAVFYGARALEAFDQVAAEATAGAIA